MKVEEDIQRLLKIQHQALVVLEYYLDMVEVHPCDEFNEDIKVKELPKCLRDLYKIFKD